MVIQCLYSVVSFFFQIDVSGSKMARKDSQPDPAVRRMPTSPSAHGAWGGDIIQGHRPVPCDGSSEDEPERMEEGQIPVCILLRET